MTEKKLKITDLARLTGVSKSTVHHYLNMGLLHSGKKEGLSQAFYDWSHLSRLKRIIELSTNQKLPLSRIKEVIAQEKTMSSLASKDSAESLITAFEEEKRVTRAQKSELKRVEIMDAAIAIFSKFGYEKTTLETIAESLDIAKSTVYLYFESKENLFMDCIDRLTVVAVPEEAWDELRREKHYLARIKKRAFAFHKAFHNYMGILTMTKALLGCDNEKLVEKAKNTLSLMTLPIAKDIRRGINSGIFREINEELVSHFFLAMGEAIGFRLMMDSRYTIEQALEIMFDFISKGLLKTDPQGVTELEPAPACSGEVTDLKGVTFSVQNIRFGGRSYLPAKLGEADVKINPNVVQNLRFCRKGNFFSAEVTGKDGQIQTAEVDGTLILSGEVSLGGFSIELKSVASVMVFNAQKPLTELPVRA
ncbi:MAG: TetR family transcriptional regulator [Deltaproteobacteria bacterium]|nr:TetR family transcriptional regulator [Deltaproteobacteria bacterium]